MLRHRLCTGVVRVPLVVCVVFLAGCSGAALPASDRTLPTAPSVLAPAAGARSSVASLKLTVAFPIVNGVFVITTETGDRLTGTYTGNLSVPIPGQSKGQLQLTVAGGTGSFSGASGGLAGDGAGDFGADGRFSLSAVSGVVATTASPAGVSIKTTIVGVAAISCSGSSRILVTMTGKGHLGNAGRADVVMTHELADTECQS